MASTIATPIQAHLIEAGYNFVAANDRFVVVQDPRWENYRVYSTEINPEDYINAHIEATRVDFDWVTEAAEYIA